MEPLFYWYQIAFSGTKEMETRLEAGNETPRQEEGHPFEANVAALAMAFIVCITMANVVVRYFTNISLAWTEEISVLMLLVLTMSGCAAAISADRMIRIGVLYEGGSLKRRRALEVLSAAASTLMFGALAVLLFRQAMDEFRFSETTSVIGLPRWWYTGALIALAALAVWRAAEGGIRLYHVRFVRRAGPEAL